MKQSQICHIENRVNIDPSWYNAKDNTFIFELSKVQEVHVTQEITLVNPQTKKSMKFEMILEDIDGEDTYGWYYQSECGKYELLIIND